MWPVTKEMQEFQALSYIDKLRVSRSLARAKAPDDPQLAGAAIELAETYHLQKKSHKALMRWLPAIMIIGTGYVAVSNALGGTTILLPLYALAVIGSVWIYIFDPVTRPKNLTRGLEASRRVLASGE